MENYCGTTRISNPKTLKRWVDNGEYSKRIKEGFIFNVGCGRFKTEVCTCSTCRTRKRPELRAILEQM